MADFFIPGTWSGLALRVAQCLFANASGITMSIARGSLSYSQAYMFLIVVMLLNSGWSFLQAVIHLYYVLAKKELHQPVPTFMFLLGDTVMSLLAIAAVSASAAVTVFFVRDSDLCRLYPELASGQFQLSVFLGFVAWFLQATSAFSIFRLLVALVTQHAQ